MQAESICSEEIEGLDTDTFIPMDILSCDVSSRSRSQDAISIVELGKQLLLSAKNGNSETVRELMCRGAPFTTDWLGTSALHLAAQNNHIDTAEILLRAGISRDARTKVDRTPLHMAAYEGHHQMAQLLLIHGADVDSRDMLKMTPLHWAVEHEHIKVIHVLLEHGANANAISKFEKTPISLALERDRLDLVRILQQERELIDIQAHQSNQTISAELEVATHNLIHLEAEEVEQKLQQSTLSKHKLAQVQNEINPRMIFQPIHLSPTGDGEQNKEIENVETVDTSDIVNSSKHRNITSLGNVNKFKFLEAHGIKMIPVDDSSIVENAMESGRTIVLTEAGKLALSSTKGSINLRRIHVTPQKGRTGKYITLKANQIINQTLPVTSRSPNILKRPIMDNKPGKVFITTIPNTTTVSTVSESTNSISLNENKAATKISSTNIAEPIILQLNNDIEEIIEEDNPENSEPITDIAVLNRQLAEAQRQAAEYFKQYKKKEKEAELYKQQLKNMTQRTSK